MNLFLPRQAVDSFRDLDLALLKARVIHLLLCDVDNTLSIIGDQGCSPQAARFLDEVRKAGIQPVLFTNNFQAHALKVMHGHPNVEMHTFACKPLPFSFWWMMRKKHLKPSQVAVLGDQLFTDMLGGNLSGCYTILSSPLSKEERRDTKLMRKLEEMVYTSLEKSNKLKREENHVRIL